jgi:DNA-binding response OmpR family regulator
MEHTTHHETFNHIVIVEDDPQVANLLLRQLNRYGYQVNVIQDFQHVDEHVKALNPDLVLLDINLPYYDGFYWCRMIRRFSKAPVVYISSRTEEMDQVFALENGGDEFITKPFQAEVVIAKIKALLRRTYGEYMSTEAILQDVYEYGPMKLDVRKALIECGAKTNPLSKTELELMRRLMDAKGEVVSRNELLETLWDDTNFVDDNTLTVNVTRLRHKLEAVDIYDAIITVRGMGYRFAIPDLTTRSRRDDGRDLV